MPYWLLMPQESRCTCGVAFWGFALRGQGTPLPWDPPKKLVVEGPYRLVRIMYWSVGSVLLGEAGIFQTLALSSWLSDSPWCESCPVPLCEEPALRRKFGADMKEYCRRATAMAAAAQAK